jgi:peptide/nickel transport system substrate-binding protein
MRGSRSFVLSLGLVVGVTLAGCGGGSHQPRPQATPATTPPNCGSCDGPDPVAHGPISIRDAQKGGIVTVLVHQGLGPTLDPTTASQRETLSIGTNVRTLTRCADWPSGGRWLPTVYGSTRSFSQPAVNHRIAAIGRLPLDQQPNAWNRLDVVTMARWFPVVPISYGGVAMAHGSRIKGMHDDNVRGMPTWNAIWVEQ